MVCKLNVNKAVKLKNNNVEEQKLTCNADGNVNQNNHVGEKIWHNLLKLRISIPYDPSLPVVGYKLENILPVCSSISE